MNEIENLRQEAETLKNAIRVSAKAIAETYYLTSYFTGDLPLLQFDLIANIFCLNFVCHDSA